jgi:hypothetical protein
MRGYYPDLEDEYDRMFNADERPRDEFAMISASDSAWYINDVQLGKHFDEDFNYDDYE